MKERVFVSQSVLQSAVAITVEYLKRRLEKHGVYSSIGPHETLGIITEEYQELIGAIHANDREETKKELIDIAVSCIFGLASLNQQDIDKDTPPKGPENPEVKKSLDIVMGEIDKDYAKFFSSTSQV